MDRPGDQFLARPSLADDQQWTRDRSHAADLVQQAANLRRIAHDPRSRLDGLPQLGVVLVEHPVPVDDFKQLVEFAQKSRDSLPQPIAADEEIGRPGRDRFGGQIDIPPLRHHHDRRIASCLAD